VSSPPSMRRADKVMHGDRVQELLSSGYSGHLGTVGPDGSPYVCPLLYIWTENKVWLHNTSANGHLQTNVRHEPRVCFEVASPGKVFAYGRFQCDTSVEYQSVVVFGRIAIVEDRGLKEDFFDGLMCKYFKESGDRPQGFYPRLNDVTVYVLDPERITGKETLLPAHAEQWPAADNTKSPHALPPRQST
jgi:nitroimidazol reductase NimA-like FMN-containing flavoprotein (pyridoxamine 5'-phosphate oxidase superfamily)